MKLTVIGDVHGKLQKYKKIVDGCENSICVGDLGFKEEWDWAQTNLTNLRHWINQGNHDDPAFRTQIPSLGRFSFYLNKVFTVAGANSIDRHLRTEGVDWFPNEELTYMEQLEAFDDYCTFKPKIVISHDCPQKVMEHFFGYTDKSQTRTMLQMMLNEHEPDLWIFGHHHRNVDRYINNCRFKCLAELEPFEIEI
jgi:predicted phosphodiesterase